MRLSALTFVLVIASSLLFLKSSIAANISSQNTSYQPITHFDEITLYRGPCLGWCPSYEVVIRGDGHVDYEGKGDVVTHGHASRTISKHDVDVLIQAINQVEYTSIPPIPESKYKNFMGHYDGPESSTSVTIDGKRYEIKSFGSGSQIGHFEIGKFEDLIDKIVRTDEWIGPERERLILFMRRPDRQFAADEAARRGDVRYLMAHAEIGDEESLFLLAKGYSEGLYGLKEDQHKAFDYYIGAANRGVRPAQKKLMEMYEIGYGAPLNYKEAYYWRIISSTWEPGNLKLTPSEMDSVEKRAKAWNPDETIPSQLQMEKTINKWFLKSAKEGDEWAQLELADFYSGRYDPTVKNIPEVATWLRKAADQGNHLAQSKLSGIYESGGVGIKQDYQEAYFWRSLSASATNNKQDSAVAELLAKHITKAQRASADKRIKEWKPTKRSTRKTETPDSWGKPVGKIGTPYN